MSVRLGRRGGGARWAAGAWIALAAGSAGCGDDGDGGLSVIDVEGPAGEVRGPGPHDVEVLTSRATSGGLLVISEDPAETPEALPMSRPPEIPSAILRGQIEAAPLYGEGADARSDPRWWVAFIGDDPSAPDFVLPTCAGSAAEWRQAQTDEALTTLIDATRDRCPPFVTRPALVNAGPDAGPLPCEITITRPADGAILTAEDDGAAQAGFQITVQATTDLEAGSPAVLAIDGVSVDTSAISAGEAGFRPVTVAPGARVVSVSGRRPFGVACEDAIRVQVPE